MSELNVLITDAKSLNAMISQVLKTYHSNGERLHVAVCSAMFNAAMVDGGNPALLNRIFEGLRTNDKDALRRFIRRCHIAIGLGADVVEDGLAAEIYQAAETAGRVFSFSAKGAGEGKAFAVVKGSIEQRAKLCALIEARLLNPDGKEWTGFMQRNNFAEVKKFGDDDIVKALKALTTKGDSERYDVSISDPMSEFMAETVRRATELAAKNSSAATVH